MVIQYWIWYCVVNTEYCWYSNYRYRNTRFNSTFRHEWGPGADNILPKRWGLQARWSSAQPWPHAQRQGHHPRHQLVSHEHRNTVKDLNHACISLYMTSVENIIKVTTPRVRFEIRTIIIIFSHGVKLCKIEQVFQWRALQKLTVLHILTKTQCLHLRISLWTGTY